MLGPSTLSFLEKVTNTSCCFGGLPFHWDRKSNRISLPLDRKDVLRWSIAVIYELCFTVFLLFRTISTRSEKMDSFARLRVICESGFFLLFSSVNVYFIFRREKMAGMVNLFLRVFELLEGIGNFFFANQFLSINRADQKNFLRLIINVIPLEPEYSWHLNCGRWCCMFQI